MITRQEIEETIQRSHELQDILEEERVMGMIDWQSVNLEVPAAGREIIAKNPLKAISYNTSSKQCQVMKFHYSFKESQIREVMLSDNLSLWDYTGVVDNV